MFRGFPMPTLGAGSKVVKEVASVLNQAIRIDTLDRIDCGGISF
jgi:hypothetical protein